MAVLGRGRDLQGKEHQKSMISIATAVVVCSFSSRDILLELE